MRATIPRSRITRRGPASTKFTHLPSFPNNVASSSKRLYLTSLVRRLEPSFSSSTRSKNPYPPSESMYEPPPIRESAKEPDYETPVHRYRELVKEGAIRGDDHQTRIIEKLQSLHNELRNYNPPVLSKSQTHNSFISLLFGGEEKPESSKESTPRSLYLYGDVGTGKTMLMDLFFDTLPPSIKRKRRVHFHAFMIDVHKRIHAAKAAMGFKGGDPILPVACDLAAEAFVLCFDEFQVTDIADAMILRRLLENLIESGVVCIMTSNRHPDELYKNGIQRSSFIPAIELIKERFDITDLNSGTDYRRIPRALSNVYFNPLNRENSIEIDKLFKSLTADSSDPVVKNRSVETWGRVLIVPESTNDVAKFRFLDLCGKPYSAADYLELTKKFSTLFLLDVPKMGMQEKDMARRFITLIDACYESKTKLFATSEVPIFQVFSNDSSDMKGPSDHMRSVMDDLGLPHNVVGTSSMFTGDEEIFAFARACSRLVQMGTKEWAASL